MEFRRNKSDIKQYRDAIKFFDCASFIYLDQIKNVKFKKVSGYVKSKDIFNGIYEDFIVVGNLINQKDIINSATILRKVYEDIIYIIATSFDRKLIVTTDTTPKVFRKVLKDNYQSLFSDSISPDFFDYIYSYLCKIIHPCSMKELISHVQMNHINRKYVLNCVRFTLLTIEFVYLDFINKKANTDNSLNESVWATCWLVNLFNFVRYLKSNHKHKRIVEKYLINDNNSKYINEKEEEIKDFCEYIRENSVEFESVKKEILDKVKCEIENSGYSEKINELLHT